VPSLRLIADPAPIQARIAEIEAAHSALIQRWALAAADGEPGEVPAPPHVAELEQLRADLQRTEAVAAAAKEALASMRDELTAAQHVVAAALAAVTDAAYAVLVESAESLAAELEQTERRSALLRGFLRGLQVCFERDGHRGGRGGHLGSQVNTMLRRGPYELHPESINKSATEWHVLFDHLHADADAQLAQPELQT
jgi:multidrug resistance efflux pump